MSAFIGVRGTHNEGEIRKVIPATPGNSLGLDDLFEASIVVSVFATEDEAKTWVNRKLWDDEDDEDEATCEHCGRPIVRDDGTTWFHPDTMSARCDGADDEPGIAWSDLVRQATPKGDAS